MMKRSGETGLVDWLKEQGMMGLHSDEEIR